MLFILTLPPCTSKKRARVFLFPKDARDSIAFQSPSLCGTIPTFFKLIIGEVVLELRKRGNVYATMPSEIRVTLSQLPSSVR